MPSGSINREPIVTVDKRVPPFIPRELVVDRIHPDADSVTVLCQSRCVRARYLRCRCASTKIHSRYERRIADLPWLGRRVTICVQVRRLRCTNTRCSQRIFGGQPDGVVMPLPAGRYGSTIFSAALALHWAEKPGLVSPIDWVCHRAWIPPLST
jgi:hypothetical protein